MQKIANPCPRVEHPVWVKRILQEAISKRKQATISSLFRLKAAGAGATAGGATEEEEEMTRPALPDIEDFGSRRSTENRISVHIKKRNFEQNSEDEEAQESDLAAASSSPAPVPPAAEGAAGGEGEGTVVEKLPVEPISKTKPETLEQLTEWLVERKAEWKYLRESRRQERMGMSGSRSLIGGRSLYGLTTKEYLYGAPAQNLEDLGEDLNDLDPRSKKRTSVNRLRSLEDMMKTAARAVSHGYWQIVELQETDMPGIFIAWSFTGPTQLQKLYLNIPRIIYVNCRHGSHAEMTAKQLNGILVKKDLPHGRGGNGNVTSRTSVGGHGHHRGSDGCDGDDHRGSGVFNLYEIHLHEQKYLKNEKALGLFLCDPMVEGVYETKAPLLYRAILRLGCIAQVSRGPGGGSGGGGGREGLSAMTAYKLKEMKFVNVTNQKYLDSSGGASRGGAGGGAGGASAIYKKIFLYHTEDSRRSGTGVLGLFIMSDHTSPSSTTITNTSLSPQTPEEEETSSFSAKAYVWLVQSRGVVERPPMQRIFRRFCSNEKISCKFITTSVATMTSAFASCNEILANYVRERRGPTIVIGQGELLPSLPPPPSSSCG
jgi:hypothetical protein